MRHPHMHTTLHATRPWKRRNNERAWSQSPSVVPVERQRSSLPVPVRRVVTATRCRSRLVALWLGCVANMPLTLAWSSALPQKSDFARTVVSEQRGSVAATIARMRTVMKSSTNAATETTDKKHASGSTFHHGALSLSLSELTEHLGGRGRAQLVWDCYTHGVDPAGYFSTTLHEPLTPINSTDTEFIIRDHDQQQQPVLAGRRRQQRLGASALEALGQLYQSYSNATRVDGGMARLQSVQQSTDGTTKFLTLLHDDTAVETVIIPVYHGEDGGTKSRSTVCLSSQVGCRQACTFCATGRMGKVRSLTTDEILAQYYFALQITRRSQRQTSSPSDSMLRNHLDANHMHRSLPPISNVVFMGMGEPADNADAVRGAVKQLTTRELFQLSATKVTVSTVAPTPDAFRHLSHLSPCVLAWSVHAARDDLRRQLVPTTRYPMVDLRQGLIDTLLQRPRNFRTTMVEVALMDQVNDSLQEAEEMADFASALLKPCPIAN